jgi:hypothetical protein
MADTTANIGGLMDMLASQTRRIATALVVVLLFAASSAHAGGVCGPSEENPASVADLASGGRAASAGAPKKRYSIRESGEDIRNIEPSCWNIERRTYVG